VDIGSVSTGYDPAGLDSAAPPSESATAGIVDSADWGLSSDSSLGDELVPFQLQAAARGPRHHAGPAGTGNRANFPGRNEHPAREFKEFESTQIIACGTSWHAALA